MFDFEKLDIYKKAKSFNSEIRAFIKLSKFDPTTKDQLRRASFSVVLNIAEGTGRFSNADRRNFYVYQKAKLFHQASKSLISEKRIISYEKDQLLRASFSIVLNIS